MPTSTAVRSSWKMGRLIKATSSSTESRFGIASVFPRIADFPAIAPPFLELALSLPFYQLRNLLLSEVDLKDSYN